jgi:hypothetical protein
MSHEGTWPFSTAPRVVEIRRIILNSSKVWTISFV